MKREDLIKLGIAEDLVDQIMSLHGKDLEKHKTTAEAAKTELDGVKAQLTEANKQIDDFKGMDIEGVKKGAEEWKQKAEQAEAEAQKQVAQLQFNHALDAALAGVKAKDPVAVRAHLKLDDLKLSTEGAIIGLDDQLKTIKDSHNFLFEDATPVPKIVTGGNNPPAVGDPVITAMRRAAGLPETPK